MVESVALFAKESNNLDKSVKDLAAAVAKDDDASATVKKTAVKAAHPVGNRDTLRKVSGALQKLAAQSNKVESTKLNEDDGDDDGKGGKKTTPKGKKAEAGGSAGAIIGAVVGVLAVVGGVAYCKCNEKLCFKKDE